MALYHFSAKILSRSARNTVGAIAYRAGCKLYDVRTGETINYQNKEVQCVELLLPHDAPQWARDIQSLMLEDKQKGVQALVDIMELAEKRIDAQVWREFEFALHRELTKEQNIALAREFVQDQLCQLGMTAQLNFHFDVDEETGEGNYPQEKPHCHVVVTTRRLEESEMGAKEREWNKKELLCELREKWQDYSNFHLKLHGHDVQIDHRSNKERRIEMEPQPKRGRGLIEQERRLQKLEGSLSPVTDKAREFHEVQLRNLYRIMRNPDVVFDIVTKHHATFMWADVQKLLHRYVDDASLFYRLEAKLKSSHELMFLREDPDSEDRGIFTTRSMLKAERSLVEKAESLGKNKTHFVQEHHIDASLRKANKALEEHGSLSGDQMKAISHLVDGGQLKCVVGIAGAGKTTALGICQEIWKESGYAVYGLTPTGKAAQNLEDSGIPSMTLHKFLKSYEEGRCQYKANSVLVLDEAGMVDVERFEKLLGAVKELGVKLIVVGDGAQLQPVEAGPAFRLVTERLGKSELNTVLRQKEDWQKQATVLFGHQHTEKALTLYQEKGRIHLIEKRQDKADPRYETKRALIKAWHEDFKAYPNKSFLVLAHTNRDVKDLNTLARSLLKKSGYLSQKEHSFVIKKEEEDDFGKKLTKQEAKGFSKGDQLVFTRNNYGLGVKNGSMGTIQDLNKQKIKVKLDDGKEISFSPNLNPYFDQGWAITIHKSQGTTVDRSYVLASSSMTQNLTYVAMTRHRKDVQMFGSSKEFPYPKQLPHMLSKSGEKLSAADYIDADSLNKLMQQEDKLLTKFFTRMSHELEAMGAVSKKAFWQIADHFLGMQNSQVIRVTPDHIKISLREETRAETLFKKKQSFEDLYKICERTLYDYLASENRTITQKLKIRIVLQSEKAADFILHQHTLKGSTPTQEETKCFLFRAKYELDRIPEIRQEIIEEWDQEGHFDKKRDPILAHMIADRQASIEGRLYFEAKKAGKEPSSRIPDLAEKELKRHHAQTKALTAQLAQKYSLSENAAIHCAKDILRYKETHGESPSQQQIMTLVHIARDIEKTYPYKAKESVKIIFLRRQEGDLMFRQMSLSDKPSITPDITKTQNQAKASLESICLQTARELQKMNQREMSL